MFARISIAVGIALASLPGCSGTIPRTGGTDPVDGGGNRADGAGPRPDADPTAPRPDAATDPGGVRAFPGAQGFGALATGGRGGRVIKVTTLAASGAGSFRAAIEANGPRIVVFAVSGVIDGDYEIPNGDLTIAGQTAPGGGITIRGRLYGAYEFGVDNMIIRHLRIRPVYDGSDGSQFDGIQFSRNARLIFDHISVSSGVDETVDLYSAKDVTVQWSTIESSGLVGHPEGEHNYGIINGPQGARFSFHHNLLAHHKNRCPAIATGPAEVRNNVMYNVRHGFIHHNPAVGQFNIVGNYFKDGADDQLIPFFFDDEAGTPASQLSYFMRDNFIDDPASDCTGSVDDPWTECTYSLGKDRSYRSASEFGFSGAYYAAVSTQSATAAYDAVLDRAGAFPRDVVSRKSVADTMARTGRWGAANPADLMEGLTPTTPPADADNDGMADAWESAHGLDPADGADHATVMPSGYTAIEVYINELADALVGS